MNKTVEEILRDHPDTLSPGELMDLLTSIDTVKANGGQGSVKATFNASEMNDIDIHVGKPKPAVPISKDVARWPRFILTPIE